MVKAILLDFWGTLMEQGIFPSPFSQVKYFLGIKIPFSDFAIRLEDSLMLQNYDDLFQAFTSVCEAFDIEPQKELLDRLVGMWNKNKLLAKLFPETLEILKDLKSKYKLVLVSNTDCFSTKDLIEKFNLAEYFDFIALSHETKMLKTNPRLFNLISEKIDVDKDDMIMVGDSIPTDIMGAKKAGLKAVLVDRRDTRDYDPKVLSLKDLEKVIQNE